MEKVVSETPQSTTSAAMQYLLSRLRGLITSARTQVLRAVDVIQA